MIRLATMNTKIAPHQTNFNWFIVCTRLSFSVSYRQFTYQFVFLILAGSMLTAANHHSIAAEEAFVLLNQNLS